MDYKFRLGALVATNCGNCIPVDVIKGTGPLKDN